MTATDTPRTTRWRSSAVALAILGGAAALSGCSAEPEYRRNGYATREACLRDYPPSECSAATGNSGGFFFLGPWYSPNRALARAGDPGPGATAVDGTSKAAASTNAASTRRGGFGATGRSYGYRGG